MRPTDEAMRKWIEIMYAIRTMTVVNMPNLNQLLKGLVTVAMQNPLLRTLVIDGESHIAHVTPLIGKCVMLRGTENPLENRAESIGKTRARLDEATCSIVIEYNKRFREKTPIGRELDEAIDRLGRASVGPLGLNLEVAEQHSHLVSMTRPSFGSAFEWEHIKVHTLETFQWLDIVERKGDRWRNCPTFDLVLRSS